jgi:uncharacterized protein YjaG (DUF416 family)
MNLRFDEDDLVRRLDGLAPRLRVAFAAACAERLFPAYELYANVTGRGEAAFLRDALDAVWEHLHRTPGAAPDASLLTRRAMQSLHDDETSEPFVPELPAADSAATAIVYALRALDEGSSQEAAWAARHAYEAADYFVTHVVGLEDEDAIDAHPAVQAELERQNRDLEELLSVAEATMRQTLERLRRRASEEGRRVRG